MEEREAIAQLQRGDIDGLAALVRRYYVSAVRVAYGITRDRSLAEDIVQETFLRTHERIGQFDAARAFAPWFLRSVANAAITAARRADIVASWDGLVEAGTVSDVAIDPTPGPEAFLVEAETQAELWTALEQLPPAQRAVIVQRYYLNATEREIAASLGSPAGTVKWRLHAARTRLRALLHPS